MGRSILNEKTVRFNEFSRFSRFIELRPMGRFIVDEKNRLFKFLLKF